ncbi:MAG: PEP-CTERM sorting domain-containing protein [Verrucomicrobiales bacterium]|nr:PEP-CTERM sorting domain-containing protein [Verrucomicrobiales bacterium]
MTSADLGLGPVGVGTSGSAVWDINGDLGGEFTIDSGVDSQSEGCCGDFSCRWTFMTSLDGSKVVDSLIDENSCSVHMLSPGDTVGVGGSGLGFVDAELEGNTSIVVNHGGCEDGPGELAPCMFESGVAFTGGEIWGDDPGEDYPFDLSGHFGFSFDNGGTTNYGFARFEFSTTGGAATTSSYTITDWAYDDTGATISFGAAPIPEPSRLGLLALGMGAAGLLRRRKKA